MNKKTKIFIIVVSVVAFVAVLLGVLYWGLQPVQKEKVTLEKLNKKLGDRYCMPSQLPFDGEVECEIIYVRASMGVVLTRFEISPKRSTGYSVKLKDSDREIYVGIDGTALSFSEEDEDSLKEVTKYYNNQKIYYFYIPASDKGISNWLAMQFEIDGKAYIITAEYFVDVDSDTLKSDIEFILDQMIK